RRLIKKGIDIRHQPVPEPDIGLRNGFPLFAISPRLVSGAKKFAVIADKWREYTNFDPPFIELFVPVSDVPPEIGAYEGDTRQAQLAVEQDAAKQILVFCLVVAAPNCRISLYSGKCAACQYERASAIIVFQTGLIAASRHLHSIDIFGFGRAGLSAVEIEYQVIRQIAAADRMFVHVIPIPVNAVLWQEFHVI